MIRYKQKLKCSTLEFKSRNAFSTGISCSTPTIQKHDVDELEVTQVREETERLDAL
jgi:hypothetical protein